MSLAARQPGGGQGGAVGRGGGRLGGHGAAEKLGTQLGQTGFPERMLNPRMFTATERVGSCGCLKRPWPRFIAIEFIAGDNNTAGPLSAKKERSYGAEVPQNGLRRQRAAERHLFVLGRHSRVDEESREVRQQERSASTIRKSGARAAARRGTQEGAYQQSARRRKFARNAKGRRHTPLCGASSRS